MGFEKLFCCGGCVEVTLILRDYKTVTGRIIKCNDDRNPFVNLGSGVTQQCNDHFKRDKCDDRKKHDNKCCDDKCDFILLELTKDAESVSLQEIERNSGFEIEWVNVEFPKGTCIAVNVCDIIYAGVNAEIEEQEFELGGTESNTTVPKE